MEEKEIITFFEEFVKGKALDFKALPQSGSSRKNFIANSAAGKYVVTYNSNISENEAFFYFTQIFGSLHLNIPEIFRINDDRDLYIQSYLGSNTLSEIIVIEGESERVKKVVKSALNYLFELQTQTLNKIDYSKTFEYAIYDKNPVLNDLFYFKNFFADVLELPYHKSKLIQEFLEIASLLEKLQPKGLMLRDFQARNIMVNDFDEIYFIDYQAAMEGPLMYDVISFLFQAKANFTENFKSEMLGFYIEKFEDLETKNNLRASVKPLQLIRFLQVLGAYGFRGLVQKKSHFIASIPKGIENLQNLVSDWEEIGQFPELMKLVKNLKFDNH